jgi:hypothetical protein
MKFGIPSALGGTLIDKGWALSILAAFFSLPGKGLTLLLLRMFGGV